MNLIPGVWFAVCLRSMSLEGGEEMKRFVETEREELRGDSETDRWH